MPSYRVELWPDLRVGPVPFIQIEAVDELHAAALGVSRLREQGHHLPVDGNVQIGERSFIYDEIYDWLNSSEGRAFADANGIAELTF